MTQEEKQQNVILVIQVPLVNHNPINWRNDDDLILECNSEEEQSYDMSMKKCSSSMAAPALYRHVKVFPRYFESLFTI
jgi:hypothetical protein